MEVQIETSPDDNGEQAHHFPEPLNLEQVPELCAEYGQQLEFRGSNDDALAMFESALSSARSNSSGAKDEEEKLSYSSPVAAAGDSRNDDNDDDDAVAARQEEEARRAMCLAGVARCTLRSGDLRKGLRLAREAGSVIVVGNVALRKYAYSF